MDSPPVSRAGRTFWTVWNYITEVVARYLRPEPTNIVTNDTSSEQEATGERNTDDQGDDEKNEIKSTKLTHECGSEVQQRGSVVVSEQSNVSIGAGLGRENMQNTEHSSRGSEIESTPDDDELEQETNRNTTQNDTKEELNEGKELQLDLLTEIQFLLKEPTSEMIKGQGEHWKIESYNNAELNRSTVAISKQEGVKISAEAIEEFQCVEDGNKTEESKIKRDDELHLEESPNRPSVCVEPALLLDNYDVYGENKDRVKKHDAQSTEDGKMESFSEIYGEDETIVPFMETEDTWKQSESTEFLGNDNREDLCVTTDEFNQGDVKVKFVGNMEELLKTEEREDGKNAIQVIDRRLQEQMLEGAEHCVSHFRLYEQTNENLDLEINSEPLVLCEGFSDEERKLGRGQDIFASEAELELQMSHDNKRCSMSNDEITVAIDEQRVVGNIERIVNTALEQQQEGVPEDRGIRTEDLGSSEIEDDVVDTATKKGTEEVKDKVTGPNSFCDQERNVEVEENQQSQVNISIEVKSSDNEVEGTVMSLREAVGKNNTVEIRGGEKYISPGLCQEPVVAQELKRVACERIQEEIPEYNNGKELKKDTVPGIIGMCDEKLVTPLQEECIESDCKDFESVVNTATCLKSDNSQPSEVMDEKKKLKTVEGLFVVGELKNDSDPRVERNKEKVENAPVETKRRESVLLNETEVKTLQELPKTEAKSQPMENALELSDDTSETEVCSSDETLRVEAGSSIKTEDVEAQLTEEWMESNTAGTEFGDVKETQAKITEVSTEAEPIEYTEVGDAGSMQESTETNLRLLRENVDVVKSKPLVESETVKSLEINAELLEESEDLLREQEAVLLTEKKAVLNESLETVDGFIDQSSQSVPKLKGSLEAYSFCGEVVQLEDTSDELSGGSDHIKPMGMEDLVAFGAGEESEDEMGNTYETDADKLNVGIDTLALRETQSGTVDTEARILLETTSNESELFEELSETEISDTGLQTDKEVKREMIEVEASMKTEIKEFVDSEAVVSVEMEDGLVRTVEVLPEEVLSKFEASQEIIKLHDTSEDVGETEPGFSEEMEDNSVENRYASQEDLEKDILDVRTEQVSIEILEAKPGLSAMSGESLENEAKLQTTDTGFIEDIDIVFPVDTEKIDSGLLGKSDAKNTLKIITNVGLPMGSRDKESVLSETDLDSSDDKLSEAQLHEESVYNDTGLQEANTDLSDVEESVLSEEIVDSVLAKKTNGTDTEFVKDYELGLFEQMVKTDATLKKPKAEISDVENKIGLSEEIIDAGLAEKTNWTKTDFVKNKEVGQSEKSLDSEAGLHKTKPEIPDLEGVSGLSEENTGAGSSYKPNLSETEFVKEVGLSVESVDCNELNTEIPDVEKVFGLSEEIIEDELTEISIGVDTELIKPKEFGLSKGPLDTEAALQVTNTEIPDVEKESGLSEGTVDKTPGVNTELVKNTEAELMIGLEAEISDESTEFESRLLEKTEENTPKKSLENKVELSSESDEKGALEREEVVDTGPGIVKQLDFGSQAPLLEVEVGEIKKPQVGWPEETAERDAGVPVEKRGDDSKTGISSPSETENVYQNLLLQFDDYALDVTAQKDRIALKNPQARPPMDPHTLLKMPSLEPSPSKPIAPMTTRSPIGIPMGGMGGIRLKLPGVGAGLPVLRKTEKGVRCETNTENVPQESETKPEVRAESLKEEETKTDPEERKAKWTPPRMPGFGNPLMMNELKNKLKKTTKDKGND
ncbi:hypothetical protein UPYG_G00142460 [Umbra pygmaea]|uniref:Uncharacterized protein n=1 Tax=Umbra pygmaea TaxID=75934 RepID=A0ABD0X076_UMBPY